MIKNKDYISKDIFSDLKTGSYFYTNGWQIKGVYSMIIGFIFAASTIWNVELRFLQSFAWLIGAFTSYITYYLLAECIPHAYYLIKYSQLLFLTNSLTLNTP